MGVGGGASLEIGGSFKRRLDGFIDSGIMVGDVTGCEARRLLELLSPGFRRELADSLVVFVTGACHPDSVFDGRYRYVRREGVYRRVCMK